MNENLRLIDTVVTILDRLTVQGIHNMGLVIDCINTLGVLRDCLGKEGQQDVRTDSQ